MDDEPISLDLGITGGDDYARQMMAAAKQMREVQRALDASSVAAARFDRYLQDAAATSQRLSSAKSAASALVPQSSGGGSGGGLGGMVSHLMGGGGGVPGGMVGRIASVLPQVAEAAKAVAEFAGPLYVAAKAVEGMADAAKEAAKDLKAFQSSMNKSGGTAQETGQLKGLSDLLGGDMSAMSRHLADKLATDGPASAFGASIGIHDTNSVYSDADKARNLLRVADAIHSMTSDAEAIRVARALDVEELLPLRQISDDMYENFKKTAKMAGSIRTDQDIKNAMAFNTELSRFATEAATLGGRLTEGLIPGFTSLLTLAANGLHAVNKELDIMGHWWAKMMGRDEKQYDHQTKTAQQEHAEAMREHSRALKAGTYGGGDRARGAMPSAWVGSYYDRYGIVHSNMERLKGQARALGAFNL